MRVAVFSAQRHDRTYLDAAARGSQHELTYFDVRLTPATASLAAGFEAIAVFVQDQVTSDVLYALARMEVRFVVLRCAGFNNVDLVAAKSLGVGVARVPTYSPHAVAEHAVGLMLALNRKIHRAYARVRDYNFSLDGLLGFDMFGRTVGIVGTGSIGSVVVRILTGFGCRILVADPKEDDEVKRLGASYVPLDELWSRSDIVTLHCPLTPETFHLVGRQALAQMKGGVMLINTSRGAVIDARAVVDGLKSGKVGYLGLDVYEEEGDVFYQNLSEKMLGDDVLARLLTFPNVLITSHQGFFTHEALTEIGRITIDNLDRFAEGGQASFAGRNSLLVPPLLPS